MEPVAIRKTFTFAGAADTNSSAFYIPAGVVFGSLVFEFGITADAAKTWLLQRFIGGIEASRTTGLAPADTTDWRYLRTSENAPAVVPSSAKFGHGGDVAGGFTQWLGTTAGPWYLPPGWYRVVVSAAPGVCSCKVNYARDRNASDVGAFAGM